MKARFILLIILLLSGAAQAQWTPTPGDTLTSVRILTDNRIVFSIYAPRAREVSLGGTDIPGMGMGGGAAAKKLENGIWTVMVGPVPPGSYRYNFSVDGLAVIDPRNPLTSQSNMNTWSLVHVPGAAFMDTAEVPHGAVAEITYYSASLKRYRRMHVYTPPGYEKGSDAYPVFYLLHGAFDCDDSWSTVGRAGFILDNLIAAGKAKPMMVVMPAGHTGGFRYGEPLPDQDPFVTDFIRDIAPYINTHYRVLEGRANRAIAGLSMGGAHTLNIAIPYLEDFAYIGVFSSGIFDVTGDRRFSRGDGPSWEKTHTAMLDDPETKKGLKLFWFATGSEDFLVEISRATVAMFRKHGFDPLYKESGGGHTWINWREYLEEFGPMLFQ